VWTGADAARHGLIDRLGGLDDALVLARELAKLPAPRRREADVADLRPRPRRPGLAGRFLEAAAPEWPPELATLLALSRERTLLLPPIDLRWL
jgi:protease-4